MDGQRRTWELTEFHSGIDLRGGDYDEDLTGMRTMDNVYVTSGRKIKRRPPCKKTSGAIDSKTQGLLEWSGQKYVFAKKGNSIAFTGSVAAELQVLYFDNPEYCSDWELIKCGVYNNQPYALIKHTYASEEYPSLVFLHVWDELLYAPTYVQDPHIPLSFSPSIGDLDGQKYDADFKPVSGDGASRLFTSTIRGNTNGSGIEDARVWNLRTKDAFLTEGEEWCFVVPEGDGEVRTFIVPRDASWLRVDDKLAYYVLERAVDDAWVPMEEVTIYPVDDFTWSFASTVSRFTGGWNEITLRICWGSAEAGLIRFRMVAGDTSVTAIQTPTVEVVQAGSSTSYKVNIGQAKYSYRGGDSVTVSPHTSEVMADQRTFLLGITTDNAEFPELVDITGGFPTGWKQEHYFFFKKIVTDSTLTSGQLQYLSSWSTPTTISGTVTNTAGSTSVTGSGTSFTSQLTEGDTIRIGDEDRVVEEITTNTALTVSEAFDSANSGAAIKRLDGYAYYDGANTHIRLSNQMALAVREGQTIIINGTTYIIGTITEQDVIIKNSSGAAGNYVSATNMLYTFTRTGVPTVTDYTYASDQTNNEWYAERVLEYTDMAGADNAVIIATSSHNSHGGLVTSISSINQRLLVSYGQTMQLWQVDQNPDNFAHLDDMDFGTGEQLTPVPIKWYSSVVLPVESTFRAISLTGANVDNLDDSNIGEKIDSMPFLQMKNGLFWQKKGQIVIAGTTESGSEIRIFDYSKKYEISAWSRWEVDGLTLSETNSMIVESAKLWIRSNNALYSFDYDDTSKIDFNDDENNAYLSTVRFKMNNLKKPGLNKRYTAFDIVQRGKSSVMFELPHRGMDFQNDIPGPYIQGPTIKGVSYGRTRIPMTLTAQAIAVVVESRDESDWELHSVAVDFLLVKR